MTEQAPYLVAGHARSTELFEQPRRADQGVDQDPDHTIFDFLGGEPPALGAIISCLGD
jgi:hypothetical protein